MSRGDSTLWEADIWASNTKSKKYKSRDQSGQGSCWAFLWAIKVLLAIFQRPCRSDRSSINTLARICVALTDLRTEASPLYADEPIFRPDPSCGEEEDEEEGRNEVPETLSVLGLHVPSLNAESMVPSSPGTGDFYLSLNSSPATNSTFHRPKRSSRGKGNSSRT